MLIAFAILIGLAVSLYGVFSVMLVYKYKGRRHVSYIRLFSTASSALLAVAGLYVLRHVIGDGSDLPLNVSIAFTGSIIIGIVVFLYINKKEIG